MVLADYIVLLLYVAGIIGVGLYFATQVKSSADMFAAGGRSPWWVSGLSGFMTMFSAGTFVVWGGIAYRYGVVAISISLCYGVAALIVGWTVAGRWRRLGVGSAAEFLQLRYGRSIVQLYTWLQGLLLTFMLGGTVYALSAIVCELIVLPPGLEDGVLGFVRDDASGKLSVPWTSAAVLAAVVLVTLTGGLWAVLVTDTLQFIVLSVSVAVVVPLMFLEVGGLRAFADGASGVGVPGPEGSTLLSPVAGDYTWWFLLGWVVIHYFKIGGEWAFVQRFTCVPTPRDARKSAMIFGAMYLVSPIFWMLPPIIYRVLNPIPEGLPPEMLAYLPQGAIARLDPAVAESLRAGLWESVDPAVLAPLRASAVNGIAERAYINACRSVLPAGLIGLMVAAMISATASSATTQLNVYAEAFTNQVYRLFHRDASDRALVRAGRVLTFVLGAVALAGALVIPAAGTYTGFIIAATAAMTIPLVLPAVWGLFSRRVGLAAAWTTTLAGVAAAMFVKLGLQGDDAPLRAVPALAPVADLASRNATVTDWVVGLTVPVLCLLAFELAARREHAGWARSRSLMDEQASAPVRTPSALPAIMCGWTVVGLAILTAALAAVHELGGAPGASSDRDGVVLLSFAGVLGLIGAAALLAPRLVAAGRSSGAVRPETLDESPEAGHA